MTIKDKSQLQADLYAAHEEAQRDDKHNRMVNKCLREEWQKRGGEASFAEHFEWLRTRKKEQAV